MGGSTGSVAVATCNSAGGGGVTTWAISTSSPVGWMALIGACLSCTTTGASGVLIGSATSTGISAGVVHVHPALPETTARAIAVLDEQFPWLCRAEKRRSRSAQLPGERTRTMLSAGGSLTKNHGLVIASEKVGDKRVYSIKA